MKYKKYTIINPNYEEVFELTKEVTVRTWWGTSTTRPVNQEEFITRIKNYILLNSIPLLDINKLSVQDGIKLINKIINICNKR